MSVENHLRQLGFNFNEMKVYLALADLGKSTPALLGKRLDIPRTTVYSVLENLTSKGVVSLERKAGTSFYKANNPKSFLGMIKREKELIEVKEQVAKELIKTISPFFKSRNFSIPKLQLFEGKQNVENMLYEFTDKWQEDIKAVDYTWWGYQDSTFVEHYLTWLEYVWQRADQKEYVKLFSNKAPIEKIAQRKLPARRIIRYLPEEYHFSSTIWVLGSYIVLIMTAQKPHYAFQLKDAVFAANLRTLFKLLWSTTDA